MLSFVIPAHNEEAVLGDTLRSLRAAAEAVGGPFEVIVVDDASTDRTADVARAGGAAVVPVALRNIGAVRNAGARAARGDVLVFVDADTLVPAKTLAAVVGQLRRGAVAGGARVRLDDATPLWGRVLADLIIAVYIQSRLAGGCFLFARREAFEAVGGFDETYYATEEAHLSRALRRRGKFVIVREAVVTSGRKFRMFSPRDFLRMGWWFLAHGVGSGVKRRDGLGMWYGGRREPAAG